MSRTNYAIVLSFIILIFSSCGNKREEVRVANDEPLIEQQVQDGGPGIGIDTATVKDIEREEKEEVRGKKDDTKVSSSHSHHSTGHDNMRGFDPASEDDMDDNGMSRYMENNDEEGWE